MQRIFKSKKAKLLMLFLTFVMIVTSLPTVAFGVSEIVVNSLDYDRTTALEGSAFTRRNGFMDSTLAKYYYSVNIPKTYNYVLAFDGSAATETANVSISINDKQVGAVTVGKNKKDYEFTIASLEAGKINVVFEVTNGTVFYYNLKFKPTDEPVPDRSVKDGPYKKHVLPCVIEAEDFDGNSATSEIVEGSLDQFYRIDAPITIADNGMQQNILYMKRGDSAEYTFNVMEAGIYNLGFDVECDGKVAISYDGGEGYIEANLLSYTDILSGGRVYLTAGMHTVKIKALNDIKVNAINYTTDNGEYININDLSDGGVVKIGEPKLDANPVYKELYVSVDGKVGANGSEENPFASIDAAKSAVRNMSSAMTGDIIVNIKPGRYVIDKTIEFTEKDSGKNGFDIIYRGTDSDNKPIIDGGVKITGWEKTTDKLYSAKVSGIDDMRVMYINGYPAQRARTKYRYSSVRNYDDPSNDFPVDGFYVSKRNFPKLSNLENLEIIEISKWVANRNPIADVKELENEWLFIYDQPWFHYADTQRGSTNTKSSDCPTFAVENAPELLDEPGEFFYDTKTKTVYYYPFAEENMETAEVYAPKVEGLVKLLGENKDKRITNIKFDNIEFRHGAWNLPSVAGVASYQSDHIYPAGPLVGDEMVGATYTHAQITVEHADELSFTNCNFINLGSAGISMLYDVHNAKVTGNLFRDMSGTSVMFGNARYPSNSVWNEEVCSRLNMTNNVLRRVGSEYYYCPGIGIYYANAVTLSHNDIEDTPYSGITMGWGWSNPNSQRLRCSNHEISYNRINRNSIVCRDGAPVYTLGRQDNSEIAYNYFSNSFDYGGGVYHDSGSLNISTHDNVIENGKTVIMAGTNITDTYNNYANFVDQGIGGGWSFARKETPIRTEGDNWSAEAREIMAGAGLEDEYKHLLDNAALPEWRTEFMTGARADEYAAKTKITVESTDWIPGGQNVGYYSKQGPVPLNYSWQNDGSVIGNTNAGDWMIYNVDIPYSGTWTLKLLYSLERGKDANVTADSGIKIYVDGKEVVSGTVLPSTASWNDYQLYEACQFPMEEGNHNVKLEFWNGGFAFDEFELLFGAYENESEFDDGLGSLE